MAEDPKFKANPKVLSAAEIAANAKAAEPQAERNLAQQAWDGLGEQVGGSLSSITTGISSNVEKLSGGKVLARDIEAAVPIAGALAVAGVGYTLFDPIRKGGQALMGGVKKLVTGFGYFEKIPVLGGAFSLLGQGVDMVGNVIGGVATAVLSVVALRALQVPEPAPVLPTGQSLEPEKKSIVNPPPVIVTPLTKRQAAIDIAKERLRAAKERLRDSFKPGNDGGKPADPQDMAKLKEVMGEEGLREFQTRAFGSKPEANGTHKNMTEGRAKALLEMVDASHGHASATMQNNFDIAGKVGIARGALRMLIRNTPLVRPFLNMLTKPPVEGVSEPQRAVQERTLRELMRDGVTREATELAEDGRKATAGTLFAPVSMGEHLSDDVKLDEALVEAARIKGKTYTPESIDAVRDTVQWMRGHGNRQQHKAGNEVANDPQRLGNLLETYENASAEAKGDLGMLTQATVSEYNGKVAAEAAAGLKGKPGISDARLAELEKYARETLDHLTGDKATPEQRAAAENMTKGQIEAGMLDFHANGGKKSMTDALMEASTKPAATPEPAAPEAATRRTRRRDAPPPVPVDPLMVKIMAAAAARAAANKAAGEGPTEFSPESMEAVKKTVEWLKREGAKLHNKVAGEILADPNRIGDLLQTYEVAPPEVRADVGLLTRTAMHQHRSGLLAEAVDMVRAENPSMPTSELAKLEKMAGEALDRMQAETGVEAGHQRAGETITPRGLADAMQGKSGAPVEVAAVPAVGTTTAAAEAAPKAPQNAGEMTAKIVEAAGRPMTPAAPAAPKAMRPGFSGGRVAGTVFDVMIIQHTIKELMKGSREIKSGDVLEQRRDGTSIVVTQPDKKIGLGINFAQPLTVQHVDAKGKVLGAPMQVIMLDPSEHFKRTTQVGQGTGALLNIAGRGRSLLAGGSLTKGAGTQKLGGKILMYAYVGEKLLEAGQEVADGKNGQAGATVVGTGANVGIWCVPGGFLVGTAPTRLAKELEEYREHGTPVNLDGVFYETLPGMVVAPVADVDQIIGEMMVGMPRNYVLTLPPNKDGTPSQPVDLNEMYQAFPQYRNAVMILPTAGKIPPTKEEIEQRRIEMLADPIYAWMKICEHRGDTFPPGDEGRRIAGAKLMEYSSFTNEQIRPEAVSTMAYAVGHHVSDWATGGEFTFDEQMKKYDLAIAAREIRAYSEMRFASADNAFRNTGSQGQAPLKAKVGDVMLPLEPQPVVIPANLPAGADTSKVWMQQNAETIRKMLKENAGDLIKTQSYTAWMKFDTQRYENTLEFLKETRTVLGSAEQTAKETAARQKLLDLMSGPADKGGLGLTVDQANNIVPRSPRERITLFAGEGGIQVDGYNFPEPLEVFAREYEKHVGVGAITVVRDGKAHGVALKDMSVTEKRDWITSALDQYTKDITMYSRRTQTVASEYSSFSYIDYKNREGFYLFNERPNMMKDLNGRAVSYEEDHKALRDTIGGAVIGVFKKNGSNLEEFNAPEDYNIGGNIYPNTEFHGRKLMVKWLSNELKESNTRMQGHMERLEQAKGSGGTINMYTKQARFMEASVALADEGLVLLGSNKIADGKDTSGGVTPKGGDWIAFKDMTTNTNHYAVGTWNDKGGFHVDNIVTADGKKTVAANIDLDLKNPVNFPVNHRLVQAMDVLNGRSTAVVEHIRHFNDAAVSFDKEGLTLIASNRTAGGQDLSTGSASGVRPGEWIIVKDKASGEMMYLEGEWKRANTRGVDEATQAFVVKQVKGRDGTVLKDEAALKALPDVMRTFDVKKGSKPPMDMFAGLRSKQAEVTLSQAAYQVVPKEEPGRYAQSGVRVTGLQMHDCQMCVNGTQADNRSFTEGKLALPEGYKPTGDFMVVTDSRNNKAYALEGEWRNGTDGNKFVVKKVASLNDKAPQAVALGKDVVLPITGANAPKLAQELRAVITPANVEVMAGKRGDQPHVGPNVAWPDGYTPKGDYIVVKDGNTGKQVVLEGKWNMAGIEGGSFAVSRKVNIAENPPTAFTLTNPAILTTKSNALEDLSQVRAVLELNGAAIKPSALAFNTQAPMTVATAQVTDTPAMKEVTDKLAQMGITWSDNTPVVATNTTNVKQQAAAAVDSVAAEVKGLSTATAAVLPTRPTTDTGRNGGGGSHNA